MRVNSDIPDADPLSGSSCRDTSCKAAASSLGSRARSDHRDEAQYDPLPLPALTVPDFHIVCTKGAWPRTAFSLFATGCCSRARKSWLYHWREGGHGIRSRFDA